jgi:HK97 family phage major capsid protein
MTDDFRTRAAFVIRGGADDQTIDLSLSSEERVERYDWWSGRTYYEVLEHRPESVDLSRAKDGLPFLESHDVRAQLGIIEDVRLEGRKLRGTVRFSDSPDAQQLRRDMLAGIKKQVSIGYRVIRQRVAVVDQQNGDEIRVELWTPMEGSSVAVAADPTVGVGRSAHPITPSRGRQTMTASATPDRAREVEQMRDFGRQFNMPAAKIEELIANGATLEYMRGLTVAEIRARATAPISTGNSSGDPLTGISPRDRREYSYAKVVLASDPEIAHRIDLGYEREVEQELRKRVPEGVQLRGGMLVPTRTRPASDLHLRAGLDSATATKGTELKFTQPGEFIEMLRTRIRVLELGATMLSGLTGPVSFPKQTAAATATWVSENPGTDVSESNLLLGTVSLAFKTLQATTSFSRQLLFSALSASVDAEQMVRRDLAAVHARAVDLAALAGVGSNNQPLGLLANTSVNLVTIAANGGAPTYDHMVDLMTEVAADNADIGSSGAFLTTSGIAGKLKKTQEFPTTNGVPVWQGTFDEGRVAGYRAAASNQVPSNLTKGTSTTVCHAVVFGFWDQLLIGEWGMFELITDPYRLKKQAMIEVTSFQAVDVALRYPEAFAAIKDALKS